MKKYLLIGLLIAFILPVQGQVENKAYSVMLETLLKHSVPEVAVHDACKMENVIFLDVRELREYEVSHIADALHVGYDDFKIDRVKEIPKNAKIITYCSVGYRSERISEKLKAAGFTDVSNLYGGIFEWKNQGYEVVNEQGLTEKVHAFSKTWGIWLRKGEKVYK